MMMQPYTVGARMPADTGAYTVSVRVNIPWIVTPLVRLQLHDIEALAGPFEEGALERFITVSKRINGESLVIINASRYEWRLLTDAEIRRLDELHLQHELAIAELQRTRASSN